MEGRVLQLGFLRFETVEVFSVAQRRERLGNRGNSKNWFTAFVFPSEVLPELGLYKSCKQDCEI